MANNGFAKFAALSGFVAVLLGAFGAHSLKAIFTDYQMGIWQTAVFYQFIHTVVLLVVSQISVVDVNRKLFKTVCFCFVMGICFFSFSLYFLAIFSIKWLGIITPVGGVFLLMAWLLLFVLFKKGN